MRAVLMLAFLLINLPVGMAEPLKPGLIEREFVSQIEQASIKSGYAFKILESECFNSKLLRCRHIADNKTTFVTTVNKQTNAIEIIGLSVSDDKSIDHIQDVKRKTGSFSAIVLMLDGDVTDDQLFGLFSATVNKTEAYKKDFAVLRKGIVISSHFTKIGLVVAFKKE